MRAIILAAGRGSRLRGSANGEPKILLSVGGMTLMERHIRNLKASGFRFGDMTVVCGWRGELVKGRAESMNVVCNHRWDRTDTLGSLMSAWTGEECLVIHGDLCCDPVLIGDTMEGDGDLVVPVDRGRLDRETMKVCMEEGRILALGKNLPDSLAAGGTMGVFMLRAAALSDFVLSAKAALDENPRTVIDDVITGLCDRSELDITAVDVTGRRWEEIDTPKDLARARELFGWKPDVH